MNDQPEILVIEDDPQIRRFLRTALSTEDYLVHEAATALGGIGLHGDRWPPVHVLDIGLPDWYELEVIRRVRETSPNLPILVVSVRSDERDKIAALDAGADDFVTKPFAVGELLARVRSALRRTATAGQNPVSSFRTGDVEVNLKKRRVIINGAEVHLTPIEYKLLES